MNEIFGLIRLNTLNNQTATSKEKNERTKLPEAIRLDNQGHPPLKIRAKNINESALSKMKERNQNYVRDWSYFDEKEPENEKLWSFYDLI